MSAVLDRPAPPAPPPPPDLTSKRTWRGTKSAIVTGVMFVCFLLALLPLAFVLVKVLQEGLSVISLDFLTEDIPTNSRNPGPGIGPAIVGTIVITAAASAMAIPLGILGAVYLHEYGGKGRLAGLIRFMANVMTGVPSIVMGLFIYIVWTLVFGLSGFGGSLALACLMLPVVIRSTEEMLRLVPDDLWEGSYALGTTKSRTVVTVVLPAALPGIVSGCLLAIARAAGETAPLLFTIGAARSANWNVFEGANTALPLQIFRNATLPFEGAQERAWGAALTLIVLTFLFTVIARMVSARFAIKR
jgi:phosphate transport system permease protein